jgi:beta-lactamase class A
MICLTPPFAYPAEVWRSRRPFAPVASMIRVRVPELTAVVGRLDVNGTCSVWLGPVTGEAWFTARPDAQHYAASTMKLTAVMAAFREHDAGRFDLDTTTRIHNRHPTRCGGGTYPVTESDDSDPAVWKRLGEQVSLRWLAYRAIVRSSNLATNLLLEALGFEPVQRLLDDLACDRSTVSRGIEDEEARDAGLQNVVTASDLARQLQALAVGSILSPTSSQEVLNVLSAQQINDALPRGIPPHQRVAHKSGWIEGVSHDVGVIYPAGAEPFVFAMCTTSDLDHTTATDLIARVAAAAWKDLCLTR